MAERTWAAWRRQCERDARDGRAPRRPRTVVLKLKTSDFRILTRSLTSPQPPADAATLVEVALMLRTRVELPKATRYRLIGVGLSNLGEPGPQADLFIAPP